MLQYDDQNREINDKTPIEIPLGYKAPETLQQMIQRLINVESYRALKEGNESFEEADDFEIEEDNDAVEASPYQLNEMQEEFLYAPPENGEQRDSGSSSSEPESKKPTSEPEEKEAHSVGKDGQTPEKMASQ